MSSLQSEKSTFVILFDCDDSLSQHGTISNHRLLTAEQLLTDCPPYVFPIDETSILKSKPDLEHVDALQSLVVFPVISACLSSDEEFQSMRSALEKYAARYFL